MGGYREVYNGRGKKKFAPAINETYRIKDKFPKYAGSIVKVEQIYYDEYYYGEQRWRIICSIVEPGPNVPTGYFGIDTLHTFFWSDFDHSSKSSMIQDNPFKQALIRAVRIPECKK